MTPQQIATAIAEFTENVSGLRTVTDAQSIVNPPCAAVLPVQGTFIDYVVALEHGVAEYNWRIIVMVSAAHERASQPDLYSYIATEGSESIPAALLADPTLGHVVDYCVPVEAIAPRPVSWAGVDYLAADIIVRTGAE